MTTSIDIRADHLRIVHDVLARHLPNGVRVWVFGSRATWATKDSSDLDLALEGDGEIPTRSLTALESAFEDSDLPYAVDVVDVRRISDRFREIVATQGVLLVPSPKYPFAAAPGGTAPQPLRWRETTLDQLGRIVTGRTPPSGQAGYFGGHIPFVTPSDFDGRRRIEATKRYLTSAGAHIVKRVLVPAEAVMVSCIGSDMGKTALASCDSVTNQQINSLLCDSRNSALFVYYNLRARRLEIRGIASGSAQPILNKSAFGQLSIMLPPLPEQCAIAHVLGTLDDKIELNRRMNATLEAMARVLFRSWFVDFDPVRAKVGGRDTGLPKEIADLFPDRLVNSDVGEIPEGWPLVPLPELMDVNPPRLLRRGDVAPYLDMANMPTLGHAPDSVVRRPFGSGMRFANGDTLVARITPCLENGKTAYVDFLRDGEVGWGSTEYIVMKSRRPLPSEFAYLLARTARFREFAIQNMSGTSGRQRVSASALSGFSMPSPPAAIGVEFGRAARLLLGRARAAVDECYVLANCRDTLLPKLISGELRVRDAERLVGAIA